MKTPMTAPMSFNIPDNPGQAVRVGLLGLGTVGTGVYKILSRIPQVAITQIAVKDISKPRDLPQLPLDRLTTNPDEIAGHPEVDVVVEVMGGKEYAYQLIRQALEAGKHVVTANKVVIAHYGPELFELAEKRGVQLLFEAAVAAGIPIVLPLKISLAGNHVQQIAGILNGTTNYILTRMEQAGLDFATALQEAQAKGFAEADPTADIEGHDATCKISILASVAYQTHVNLADIHTEGITTIGPIDMAMAKELGYAIRLIALARTTTNGALDVRVHPMLVSLEHPLAKITYENNAIWIQGDAVGDVMFYGKGAGELPTATAVAGDVLFIANALHHGQDPTTGLRFQMNKTVSMQPIEQTSNAYYIRIETEDQPGVIGMLGKACGDHQVSLDAIMQKGTHSADHSATIVLLTHDVLEANLQAALQTIRNLPTTRRVDTVLRVFQS